MTGTTNPHQAVHVRYGAPARVRAGALGLGTAPNGSDAQRNGFDGPGVGVRVGPAPASTPPETGPDHWGSVPDDEREFLASGFGAELKRIRSAAALSQARCGELVGVRGDHIGRLERGQRRPTIASLKGICRVLVPEGEREATETRLAALAGDSLREGTYRKKMAKENKHRRAAVAAAERAQRAMQKALRDAERRGEVTSGRLRSLTDRLGETVARLRAAPIPDPAIRGGRRIHAGNLRMADIEAWDDSPASEPSEDEDEV